MSLKSSVNSSCICYRVHIGHRKSGKSGNLKNNLKFRELSGNFENLKVSESLKKLMKISELEAHKLLNASQPVISYKLHQDAVTFYFHLLIFIQRKFKVWLGEGQGILDSEIHTNPVLAPSGVTVSLALLCYFSNVVSAPFTKNNPPDELGLIQRMRKSVTYTSMCEHWSVMHIQHTSYPQH